MSLQHTRTPHMALCSSWHELRSGRLPGTLCSLRRCQGPRESGWVWASQETAGTSPTPHWMPPLPPSCPKWPPWCAKGRGRLATHTFISKAEPKLNQTRHVAVLSPNTDILISFVASGPFCSEHANFQRIAWPLLLITQSQGKYISVPACNLYKLLTMLQFSV